MSKIMYFARELIRGFYWVLWLSVDIFVLFQIYYYYPVLWVGLLMLTIAIVTTYFEYRGYQKLLKKLFDV
ncbi:MAG: hypothetical protein QXV94_06195 [Thermoplasmata archaeon]